MRCSRTGPTTSRLAAQPSTPRSTRGCSARPSARFKTVRPARAGDCGGRAGRDRFPGTATCWRWSGAATTARPSSTGRSTRGGRPGSAFKPVVALAALHKDGGRAPAFTLASRVEDEPLSVRTQSGPWSRQLRSVRPGRGDGPPGDRAGRSTCRLRESGSRSAPSGSWRPRARLGFTSSLRAVPSLALAARK